MKWTEKMSKCYRCLPKARVLMIVCLPLLSIYIIIGAFSVCVGAWDVPLSISGVVYCFWFCRLPLPSWFRSITFSPFRTHVIRQRETVTAQQVFPPLLNFHIPSWECNRWIGCHYCCWVSSLSLWGFIWNRRLDFWVKLWWDFN